MYTGSPYFAVLGLSWFLPGWGGFSPVARTRMTGPQERRELLTSLSVEVSLCSRAGDLGQNPGSLQASGSGSA